MSALAAWYMAPLASDPFTLQPLRINCNAGEKYEHKTSLGSSPSKGESPGYAAQESAFLTSGAPAPPPQFSGSQTCNHTAVSTGEEPGCLRTLSPFNGHTTTFFTVKELGEPLCTETALMLFFLFPPPNPCKGELLLLLI